MQPDPETLPPPPDPRPISPADLIDAATAGLVRRAWLYQLAAIKRRQNRERPPLEANSAATPTAEMPSLPDT